MRCEGETRRVTKGVMARSQDTQSGSVAPHWICTGPHKVILPHSPLSRTLRLLFDPAALIPDPSAYSINPGVEAYESYVWARR